MFGGDSVKGTFVNSYGVVFNLITTQRLDDYITYGRPEKKDSWFFDYAWEIVLCAQCQKHLGWRFSTNRDIVPKSFFGLTESAVVFWYSVCYKYFRKETTRK